MPKDVGSLPDESKGGPDMKISESKCLESRKDKCPHRAGHVPFYPQPPTATLHVLPSCWLSRWEAPGHCSAVVVQPGKGSELDGPLLSMGGNWEEPSESERHLKRPGGYRRGPRLCWMMPAVESAKCSPAVALTAAGPLLSSESPPHVRALGEL